MGAGDDPDDAGAEGDDLGAEDRRSIERHLLACSSCRAHRSGLARALEALGVAAAALPAIPDAPSLWPALERRIAAHCPGDRSRKSKSGLRVRRGAAGRERPGAAIAGDRPARSGGMRDHATARREADGPGAVHPGRSVRVLLGSSSMRIAGASLAASVLAMFVAVPSWRRQADAEVTIRANAAPLAGLIRPPGRPQPEALATADVPPEDDRDIPPGELAQAEPIRPPAETPPAADAASSPARTAAPTRFSYDLQPGTPMPPEGRDAKLVY